MGDTESKAGSRLQAVYTLQSVHISELTHLGVYTSQSLHTSGFTHLRAYTPQGLHTSDITHLRVYTPQTLHTSGFIHLRVYTPQTYTLSRSRTLNRLSHPPGTPPIRFYIKTNMNISWNRMQILHPWKRETRALADTRVACPHLLT